MRKRGKDRTGWGVRLGCGGVFGLVAGMSWFGGELFSEGPWASWVVLGFVVVCAGLALRFGDAFWDHVRRNDWWSDWRFWR